MQHGDATELEGRIGGLSWAAFFPHERVIMEFVCLPVQEEEGSGKEPATHSSGLGPSIVTGREMGMNGCG